VETIKSGIFDTNRMNQTHQEMNTTKPGDEEDGKCKDEETKK
jgi:hypothetical protein